MSGTRHEGRSHTDWRIDSVLSCFGWDGQGKRRGRWVDVRCPFHDDGNASAGYHEQLNIFRCQACDAKGNSVTLVMQQMRLDADEAVDWLDRHVGRGPAVNGAELFFQGSSWRGR